MRTGKKLHRCKQCGKNCTRSNNLKVHMRLHTGEKPYECTECRKKFAQCSHLNRHMKVHTGVKPYQCKQCRKKFSLFGNLRRHLRVHTGEKPYQCNQCKKKFTQSTSLNRHMSLHTSVKLHRCKNCWKEFPTSLQLSVDSRCHENSKQYICKQCRTCFDSSTWLKEHITIHSREEMIPPQNTQLILSTNKLDFNFNVCLFTQNTAMFMESSMFTLQTISCSNFCSPPPCYSILVHPNIAVTYGICGSMLVVEKVVTCLSDLLAELGNEVTVRERVNICYGIVCAVDYLHHQAGIVHGYINVDNVFVTSRITAKLLDPSAAFLMHDKMCQHAESFAHDLHHLICLLITTLYDMYPAFISARDRLRGMISSDWIKKEIEECMSTSVLLHMLDKLKDTDEYRNCSRKRELFVKT